MPEWDADFDVDEPLARSLIEEQFPRLDASSARLVGSGWDNAVWLVEERWAFRFPRREIAVPLVARELAVLPRVAPLLPIPVPVPTFVGQETTRFPRPFFAYRLLHGVEPADARLSEDERASIGAELGRFLRVLHARETLEAVDPARVLPVDINGRADMATRVPRARENLATLQELGLWTAPSAVERILASAEALLPTTSALVLVHGDLHQRHVLVESGSISGVIDWGDVCRADPCIDLMLVWSLLSPAGRARFLAEYGPVTAEQHLRSRVLALVLDSMLVRYAHDSGHARLQSEAIAGIERTLID
jgi:aminoglycoside phosphotransferase (APT) family kinase protein